VLCSITEGTNETDWKDVTENVDVAWINDTATFVGNLSGRFWILFYEKRLFKLSDTEKLLSHAKRIYESTITPSYYIEIFSRLVQHNSYECELEIILKCSSNDSSSIKVYEDSKIELTIEYLSFDSDTNLDLNSRLELENFRKLLSKVFKNN
jgi:hypothetical protein